MVSGKWRDAVMIAVSGSSTNFSSEAKDWAAKKNHEENHHADKAFANSNRSFLCRCPGSHSIYRARFSFARIQL
jgi:hypothetical protein